MVFTGRNEATIKPVAEETGAHGIRADVSSDADNQRTSTRCREQMGGIDVLVNNAAFGYYAEIGALDVESDADAVRHQRLRRGGHHQPHRAADEGAGRRRHREHRIHVRHEGREGRHRLRRQQVGDPRHQPVLAGGAAAARHPRHLRLPVRSADRLGGKAGRNNPNKLYAEDIAATIMAALDMPRRALWPELAVFANNPWKED